MTPSGKRALRQSDENDFYRAKRAPQLDGDIPAERYLEAQKRMNAMPRYATADEQVLPSRNASLNVAADERLGTWVPLGPGNLGGRARLSDSPDQPQHYVSRRSGGRLFGIVSLWSS